MSYNFYPYVHVDGIATFRDSEIVALYNKVLEQGLGDLLFHDGSIKTAVQFVESVKRRDTLFWAIFKDKKVIGFFWLNRIERTHAFCHFVAFKEVRGTPDTVEAGKAAMRLLLFDKDSNGKPLWDVILGAVPASNVFALAYLHKVGLKEVGRIPYLLWSESEQKSVEGVLLRITREDLL